jgi:hypothetical protein
VTYVIDAHSRLGILGSFVLKALRPMRLLEMLLIKLGEFLTPLLAVIVLALLGMTVFIAPSLFP